MSCLQVEVKALPLAIKPTLSLICSVDKGNQGDSEGGVLYELS
jgi:hypothetical protein